MCKYLLEYVCFIRLLFITHWKYVHIKYKNKSPSLLYFTLLCIFSKYLKDFMNGNCNKNMYQAFGFTLFYCKCKLVQVQVSWGCSNSSVLSV